MRICIYEDSRTAGLEPLTLTRPASDLLCGLDSLGEKQARYFAAEVVGFLCRPSLAASLRERHPDCPVNDPVWLRAAPTVLVNARWLPPVPHGLQLAPGARRLFASGPSAGTCQGELAFAVLDQRALQTIAPATLDDCLADLLQSLPAREVGGSLIRHPWELIEKNPAQIERDFSARYATADVGHHPAGFAVTGPAHRLFIHPSAKIDPMVVADTTKGAVWIGPDAMVTAFTRLEGPCAIGAGTHLFGAKIRGGATLGPVCRVGGEVECSIVQGYSNKYHDGFLGHSYLGEWVNIAAGTITGDLRFDYQTIAIRNGGETIPTHQIKLGSIVGDHARTGLGVLLDCGTVVGAFASLLPTGQLAPREVPSFMRSGPQGISPVDLEAVLRGSAVAMRRRGREMSPVLEALYRDVAGESRQRALPFAPRAEVRRSA